MKPEDYNKLNQKKHISKKLYKHCSKCQLTIYVSDYISKCPTCQTMLEFTMQPKQSANIPRCPTCQSTNIKKISSAKRSLHAFAFGVFNKTAQSQFECVNCGYKW